MNMTLWGTAGLYLECYDKSAVQNRRKQELYISVDDVKWHLKELYQKTGYTDRVSLAGAVIDKSFIVPGL
jgi:hypothetical protein